MRHKETRQRLRFGHRRRQADGADLWRDAPQPRQPERQQIAALRRHQRMQFIEHDALERGKQERRVVRCQQQRQLLRRRQQNVGRIASLPLPPRHRRIAGAGLDLDRQRHLGDRRFQIAGNIDRQRLQRRNVQRMQATATPDGATRGNRSRAGRRGRFGQFHQCRQKPGQRLAGAGRCDQQRRAPLPRLVQQRQLMGTRRPAPRREPARENLGQRHRPRIGVGRRHSGKFRQSSPCQAIPFVTWCDLQTTDTHLFRL